MLRLHPDGGAAQGRETADQQARADQERQRQRDFDQWYSIYLQLMGRTEEAIREAELARQHDPLSPIINESLGSRLYFARRYDRALEVLRRTMEMEPSFQAARETLALVEIEMGMKDDAFREIAYVSYPDARSTSPTLAYALARAGRHREARKVLMGLKDADPIEIARIHAALGEPEAALTILERSLRDHVDHLVFIKVDPSWDAMRANPRFTALLRGMRLSPLDTNTTQALR
jgi:tetratricopeptide (TPR) repeat protein